MSAAKTVAIRIIAAWIISAVAILAVAMVVTNPETRSEYFIYRLLWTEVLCLVFWGSCISVPFQLASNRARKAAVWGTAPIIIIMSAIYGMLSFIMMLVSALAEGEGISRFHLAGQIILGAVYLVLVLLFSLIPTCSSTDSDDSC